MAPSKTRKAAHKFVAKGISAPVVDWCRTNIVTSDPENPKTAPLPYEELFRYAKKQAAQGDSSGGESSSQEEQKVEVKKEVESADQPLVVKRRSERLNPGCSTSHLPIVSSYASARSSRSLPSLLPPPRPSSTSSAASLSMNKRKYNLKNDAERNSEKYQKIRAKNREAVEKTRQKNKQKEEERLMVEQMEKELWRSTMMKIIEHFERDNILIQHGLAIDPNAPEVDFSDDQKALYQQLRAEVERSIIPFNP